MLSAVQPHHQHVIHNVIWVFEYVHRERGLDDRCLALFAEVRSSRRGAAASHNSLREVLSTCGVRGAVAIAAAASPPHLSAPSAEVCGDREAWRGVKRDVLRARSSLDVCERGERSRRWRPLALVAQRDPLVASAAAASALRRHHPAVECRVMAGWAHGGAVEPRHLPTTLAILRRFLGRELPPTPPPPPASAAAAAAGS